jgi:hypothetical protein
MGKKKGTSGRSNERTFVDPVTGKVETVAGTKAGKKRTMLPPGHPRRTHDLHGPSKRNDS